jgi:hypothetical protein
MRPSKTNPRAALSQDGRHAAGSIDQEIMALTRVRISGLAYGADPILARNDAEGFSPDANGRSSRPPKK